MKENMAVKAHRKIIMRRRVLQISKNTSEIILEDVPSMFDIESLKMKKVSKLSLGYDQNLTGISYAFSKCQISQGELSEIA
jgi:Holliday junction resolvasome RuvABC endonuclease subunit